MVHADIIWSGSSWKLVFIQINSLDLLSAKKCHPMHLLRFHAQISGFLVYFHVDHLEKLAVLDQLRPT